MREMVGGCCVCSDERGWSENPLVYCDGHGCNVAVHQACYGIIQVPSGPWFCKKCESQERAARVKCELCPQKDGALKRTDMGGWCHVVCALFIPEAWFGNVQTMEPIILKGVPPERFNKVCYICEEQGRASKATSGSCMQCNKNGCKQHFHVTCAQSSGLLCEEAGHYDNVKYCGYCSYHFKKLQKKDSHIKTIPAFKPIPADNATPEGTPEKHPPWASKNKDPPASSTDGNGGNFIHAKSLKEKKLAATSSDLYHRNSASSSKVKEEPSTSTKIGKFTTANFKETTITPSPASLFDFPGDEKDKEAKEAKDNNSNSGTDKRKKRLLDKVPATNKDIDSNKIYDWEDEEEEKDNEGSPAAKSDGGKDSPRLSSSSSTATAGSLPLKTESKFAFDGESGTKEGSSLPTSGSEVASPTNSEDTAPSLSLQSRKRSGERGERAATPEKKPRLKKQRVPAAEKLGAGAAAVAGVAGGAGGGKAKTVKEILATTAPSPPPSPPAPSRKSAGAGRGGRMNKEIPTTRGTSLSSFGASQYRDNTTPISLSSLQKAGGSHHEDMNGDMTGPPRGGTSLAGLMSPRASTAAAATATAAHDSSSGTLNPMPTSMEQLLERQWSQNSVFLMEQGQHFDIASLLNCLHQLRQENQRLEEHISSLTSRRDQLLAVNSRLSLPFSPVSTPPRPPASSAATAKDQPTLPSPGPAGGGGGDSSGGMSTPHNRSPRAGGGGGGEPAMTPPPSASSSSSSGQFARPAGPHYAHHQQQQQQQQQQQRSSSSRSTNSSPAHAATHALNHSPSKPQHPQQHPQQQQQQQRTTPPTHTSSSSSSSSSHHHHGGGTASPHPPGPLPGPPAGPPPHVSSWPPGAEKRGGGPPSLPPPPPPPGPPHNVHSMAAVAEHHHRQQMQQLMQQHQQQQHQQQHQQHAVSASMEQHHILFQMMQHHHMATGGLSGAPGGPPAIRANAASAAAAAAAAAAKADKAQHKHDK